MLFIRMPRPALGRKVITVRIPEKVFAVIKKDALQKGYKTKREQGFRVDWQGYLVSLFTLVIQEKIKVMEKGVDKDT